MTKNFCVLIFMLTSSGFVYSQTKADHDLRFNLTLYSLVHRSWLITELSEIQNLAANMELTTLNSIGFENSTFYKVNFYDRTYLKWLIYVQTTDSFELKGHDINMDYYKHERRIDSTLAARFNITSSTKNYELSQLLEKKGFKIPTITTLYFLHFKNEKKELLVVIKDSKNSLCYSKDFYNIILNGDIFDVQSKIIFDNSYQVRKERSRIIISSELKKRVSVDEIGIGFLEKLDSQ